MMTGMWWVIIGWGRCGDDDLNGPGNEATKTTNAMEASVPWGSLIPYRSLDLSPAPSEKSDHTC